MSLGVWMVLPKGTQLSWNASTKVPLPILHPRPSSKRDFAPQILLQVYIREWPLQPSKNTWVLKKYGFENCCQQWVCPCQKSPRLFKKSSVECLHISKTYTTLILWQTQILPTVPMNLSPNIILTPPKFCKQSLNIINNAIRKLENSLNNRLYENFFVRPWNELLLPPRDFLPNFILQTQKNGFLERPQW